jgi:hypothetical protein
MIISPPASLAQRQHAHNLKGTELGENPRFAQKSGTKETLKIQKRKKENETRKAGRDARGRKRVLLVMQQKKQVTINVVFRTVPRSYTMSIYT